MPPTLLLLGVSRVRRSAIRWWLRLRCWRLVLAERGIAVHALAQPLERALTVDVRGADIVRLAGGLLGIAKGGHGHRLVAAVAVSQKETAAGVVGRMRAPSWDPLGPLRSSTALGNCAGPAVGLHCPVSLSRAPPSTRPPPPRLTRGLKGLRLFCH
jgi:hypothetical protein